ncbi:MAG: hypothetical protein ACKERG_00475 [Candidatus Hodgkinia cicadicola]
MNRKPSVREKETKRGDGGAVTAAKVGECERDRWRRLRRRWLACG